MTASRFVDTNVLLYSISRDPAEAHKRAIAIELLDRDDLALFVQVLQEFYVQATRVTRPDPIAHVLAVGPRSSRGAGCRDVLSEDLSDGRAYEGVTIINPFR